MNVERSETELKSHKNSTLHDDQYTYFIISHSFLLRIINVSDKSYKENRNTHFMINNFFPKNRAVYEIMWKSIVESDRPHMTIRRIGVAF